MKALAALMAHKHTVVAKYKGNIKHMVTWAWDGAMSQKSSLGAVKIRRSLEVQDAPLGTDV